MESLWSLLSPLCNIITGIIGAVCIFASLPDMENKMMKALFVLGTVLLLSAFPTGG